MIKTFTFTETVDKKMVFHGKTLMSGFRGWLYILNCEYHESFTLNILLYIHKIDM